VLKTSTPSSRGYDEGAYFRCHVRQGCKKLVRIKLFVDDMFGNKTLSFIQINVIIEAVIGKKCQNDENDSRRRGCRRRRFILSPAAKLLMQIPS
jgi:hypothetical protein